MTPIHVNYPQACGQARRLRRLAEDHRGAAAELEGQRDHLHGAWRDPVGATYAQAATNLAREMRAAADELFRLAHLIESAALEFKKQEEAAAGGARGLAN